jgi:hypothetical protein
VEWDGNWKCITGEQATTAIVPRVVSIYTQNLPYSETTSIQRPHGPVATYTMYTFQQCGLIIRNVNFQPVSELQSSMKLHQL